MSEKHACNINLQARIERLEDIIGTLAAWLVAAQTGFGGQDARQIEEMIHSSRQKFIGEEETPNE